MKDSLQFTALLLLLTGLCVWSSLLIAPGAAQENDNTYEWGHMQQFDWLVWRDILFEEPQFMRRVKNVYHYDISDIHRNMTEIAMVTVCDLYRNGNGGYAEITNGGPGNVDMELTLSSKYGHGFNFVLDIYGH